MRQVGALIMNLFNNSLIYVCIFCHQEAHASDYWRFITNYHQVATHRTLADRISAAKLLDLSGPNYHIVVDPMSNDANEAYGGLRSHRFGQPCRVLRSSFLRRQQTGSSGRGSTSRNGLVSGERSRKPPPRALAPSLVPTF